MTHEPTEGDTIVLRHPQSISPGFRRYLDEIGRKFGLTFDVQDNYAPPKPKKRKKAESE